MLEPLHSIWIDQDAAEEEYWEEDVRVTADIPAGTPGVITLARRHPSLWPDVVAFDNGLECGVRDLQIILCTDPHPAKPPAPGRTGHADLPPAATRPPPLRPCVMSGVL
ncbi:hypothetical protein [Kitasatospora griseola]|uniref:hypothetical protein n=1 Tax=Kitasatospora griseola TaxID=2064 RepID=UPI0038073550